MILQADQLIGRPQIAPGHIVAGFRSRSILERLLAWVTPGRQAARFLATCGTKALAGLRLGSG
jgi:hypothetical protein